MKYDVTGSLCENNDKFAIQRRLPVVAEGDRLVIHDTGAHGHAMGFNYNGTLRPKELLLRCDGRVELIRRQETAAAATGTGRGKEKARRVRTAASPRTTTRGARTRAGVRACVRLCERA